MLDTLNPFLRLEFLLFPINFHMLSIHKFMLESWSLVNVTYAAVSKQSKYWLQTCKEIGLAYIIFG